MPNRNWAESEDYVMKKSKEEWLKHINDLQYLKVDANIPMLEQLILEDCLTRLRVIVIKHIKGE